MNKKFVALLLSAFLAAGAVCALSSCGGENSNAEEPSKTEETDKTEKTIKTGENVITERTGEFYSLQEAYDDGYITTDDLKNIAYYNNGVNIYEFFEVYDIGELDEETALAIRTDYLDSDNGRYIEEGYIVEDVWIDKYYGTYNDCVAVMIGASYLTYTDAIRDENVGGIAFHYSNGQGILIWDKQEGVFYSLESAYAFDFLTLNDLKNIAYYQNGKDGYEAFTPYDIGELDEETALTIKQDYACYFNEEGYTEEVYTVDDVTIGRYFGTYNGCVVIFISVPSTDDEPAVVNVETTIGGVLFCYDGGDLRIKVWKK